MEGHASLLVHRLEDRCALERLSVRLYETLIARVGTLAGVDRAELRRTLLRFRNDELDHLELACSALLMLGGDPRKPKPSPRVRGVSTTTLERVLANDELLPVEAFYALVLAEMEDADAWETLARMCEETGPAQLAARFREAAVRERAHLEQAKGWLAALSSPFEEATDAAFAANA